MFPPSPRKSKNRCCLSTNLMAVLGKEALPVDDGGACLIVLLFADPHLLEGGQGGQDGAADPYRLIPSP
ncbi:hypothetical protein SKAU_G00190360 [Synaphobranchus kaupii]|uniref:Uncharacterized protein n=1 Tax=Synaphobranchus kaupii TaxID=118154 RepID=A0A9Q1IV49_SYNKA|nr:hypothetical protein SKAU_G00190360 [Synaphobranchus kaupii]